MASDELAGSVAPFLPVALSLNKRHRIADAHRTWIEIRCRDGWARDYVDDQVKIFCREDFACHKVSVVFWQTDERDQPAVVTEPCEKVFTAAMANVDAVLSVERTHRHYVADDECIPNGEDIEAFLKREIAKPIIRWAGRPQFSYEILPNKYFYRYEPPTPAAELLKEFWRLEKEAEKMLEGLAE